MSNKKNECAMLFQNTMSAKDDTMGQTMAETNKELEYKEEKIQIIFQFAETSYDMAQIKKEVSDILKKELQKQMKSMEGVIANEKSADVIKG